MIRERSLRGPDKMLPEYHLLPLIVTSCSARTLPQLDSALRPSDVLLLRSSHSGFCPFAYRPH